MIIPFETGIPSRLKEMGFDKKTEKCFDVKGFFQEIDIMKTLGLEEVPAPDYDQVIDWLLERKVFIKYDCFDGWNNWIYKIYMEGLIAPFFEIPWNQIEYSTRYEALNAGIIEALKLIEPKKFCKCGAQHSNEALHSGQCNYCLKQID